MCTRGWEFVGGSLSLVSPENLSGSSRHSVELGAGWRVAGLAVRTCCEARLVTPSQQASMFKCYRLL